MCLIIIIIQTIVVPHVRNAAFYFCEKCAHFNALYFRHKRAEQLWYRRPLHVHTNRFTLLTIYLLIYKHSYVVLTWCIGDRCHNLHLRVVHGSGPSIHGSGRVRSGGSSVKNVSLGTCLGWTYSVRHLIADRLISVRDSRLSVLK